MQGASPHDFYELSAKIGSLLGGECLGDREWSISPGAQLSLLLNVAESLNLNDAASVLRPLVLAHVDGEGSFVQSLVPRLP